MSDPKVTFTLFVGDDVVEVSLPAKFVVCHTCEGKGTRVNPDIDGNGLTHEDFEDEDFRENYLSGMYDIQCSGCKGQRVIAVVDRGRLNAEQRKQLKQHEKDEADSRRDYDSERWLRMAESGERY
jgi:hypothetical protein